MQDAYRLIRHLRDKHGWKAAPDEPRRKFSPHDAFLTLDRLRKQLREWQSRRDVFLESCNEVALPAERLERVFDGPIAEWGREARRLLDAEGRFMSLPASERDKDNSAVAALRAKFFLASLHDDPAHKRLYQRAGVGSSDDHPLAERVLRDAVALGLKPHDVAQVELADLAALSAKPAAVAAPAENPADVAAFAKRRGCSFPGLVDSRPVRQPRAFFSEFEVKGLAIWVNGYAGGSPRPSRIGRECTRAGSTAQRPRAGATRTGAK